MIAMFRPKVDEGPQDLFDQFVHRRLCLPRAARAAQAAHHSYRNLEAMDEELSFWPHQARHRLDLMDGVPAYRSAFATGNARKRRQIVLVRTLIAPSEQFSRDTPSTFVFRASNRHPLGV
jgi:hypothetical protein